MRNLKEIDDAIKMEEYDYCLPESSIAQYPVPERDRSRIIHLRNGRINEDTFNNIDKYVAPGSLMVFNNTRVIRARILFRKDTGTIIEIFCIEPLKPSDYQISFGTQSSVEWKCIVGNLKKWKSGKLHKSFHYNDRVINLEAEKEGPAGESMNIRFSWDPPHITFGEIIEKTGRIPLPPYIKRGDNENDAIKYQTLFSRIDGSVAAPTAGLHFSENLLGRIRERGIAVTEITLHIGAGTFKPVKTSRITQHDMHPEHFVVDRKSIEMIPEYIGNIIAVGTTSVRTLETLYWLGVKYADRSPDDDEIITLNQWEEQSLDYKMTVSDSFDVLLKLMNNKRLDHLHALTKIMIVPGYNFRIVDGLITNFHQPRSTLLMLVAAFIGTRWKELYSYALNNGFRFLSYGDSSLLFK